MSLFEDGKGVLSERRLTIKCNKFIKIINNKIEGLGSDLSSDSYSSSDSDSN